MDKDLIELVRVCIKNLFFLFRNYFLVLFKNKSAELWDATNLCQLREFPGNFPTITAFVS
jgi:hypothetical protein